jgi:hypothetical protein
MSRPEVRLRYQPKPRADKQPIECGAANDERHACRDCMISGGRETQFIAPPATTSTADLWRLSSSAARPQDDCFVRIGAHLRTIPAAHVTFKIMDRSRLGPPHDIQCHRLMRVPLLIVDVDKSVVSRP